MLPTAPGQLVRFHHLGHLLESREEYDQVVARAGRCGLPIVMQGNSYGVNYLYLDAKAETGHYLEYVHLDPAAANFFDDVPRS
jgi:hypothetical protein